MSRKTENGRIRGFTDWLGIHHTKDEKEMRDVLHELHDARRLEAERTDIIVDIGQDAKAPRHGSGHLLPSFDIAVVSIEDEIERSIEVKNYSVESLWRAPQLTRTIDNVLLKLSTRSGAGLAIQGRTEAFVHCDIIFGEQAKKDLVRRITEDGEVTFLRPGPGLPDEQRVVGRRNLFDDIAATLSSRPENSRLDRFVLICKNGPTVTFARQGDTWRRLL